MTFQAYYPATEGTSMTAFTLPTDQSTEANIALADYMTRQQTCNNESGNDISLELERKTARVIVRIAGFNDQYDNDQKTVSNVRINSQFSGIADGNGTGDITAVTPYQQGNGGQGTTFTALVVSGDGDSGATFITLTDGESNTLTVKGIPELEAGNSYTYDLTVGKNTIQVQSVNVTDWTTGTTLAEGQATEGSVLTYPIALSEVTADYVGSVVCSDGNVYPAKTAAPAGKTAVGILGKVTETGHGLILALQNATAQTWNTINGWTSVTTYAGTTLKLLPDDAARGTNLTSYTTLGETTVSNWAVAQKSDYEAIFQNLGTTVFDQDGYTYDANVNAYITDAGGTAISGYGWSATEEVNLDFLAWSFDSDYWVSPQKSNSYSVRPVLGFGGQAQEQGSAAAVPEGAINGKFSVSATKQVYFSKGNLRYASGAWSFFDNQYDYYTSYSEDAWDKFGWSTSANTYGMNTSTNNSTYSGDFVDWGATMGTGWFTLSSAEWTYLFNTRTVNGGTGSGKSYTPGQSVNDKPGVVIYPDNYTGEVYSGSDWATFESAGCVFLPAAGYRNGSSVSSAGMFGLYWSATPNGTNNAYSVYFFEGNLDPDPAANRSRKYGYSVRLVREVTE